MYTYIYHKNERNVGKYTSPMAPMGQGSPSFFSLGIPGPTELATAWASMV